MLVLCFTKDKIFLDMKQSCIFGETFVSLIKNSTMNSQLQDKGKGGNDNPGHGGNNEKFITLVIVVNTTPTTVQVNENAPLNAAAEKALAQTHNTGRPLDDYELKLGDRILDMNKTAKDYQLKDGTELFLSLKAGTGGTN
jgi:hypothetical protein